MLYRKFSGYVCPTFTTYEISNDCLIIREGLYKRKTTYIPLYLLNDHMEMKETVSGRMFGGFGSITLQADSGEMIKLSQFKGASDLIRTLPEKVKTEKMIYVRHLNRVRYETLYKGNPIEKNPKWAKIFTEKNRLYSPYESYIVNQDKIITESGFWKKTISDFFLEEFYGTAIHECTWFDQMLGLGTVRIPTNIGTELVLHHVKRSEEITKILLHTITQAKINFDGYKRSNKQKAEYRDSI